MVIRGDNIGVAGVMGVGYMTKGRLSVGKTAFFAVFFVEADGLGGDGYLVEDGGPFFSGPGGRGVFVEGVTGDEREG